MVDSTTDTPGSAIRVLLFSDGPDAAAVYRSYLPDGWTLEHLTDRDDEEEKLARLASADVVLHVDVALTAAHLAAARSLRIIHRPGVGLDGLDLDAVRAREVPVCICPVGTPAAVAEHTIMLALASGRRLGSLHDGVRSGGWPKWAHRHESVGLGGTTVGVVGFGRIGQAVTRRLLAFEAEVLVNRATPGPLGDDWPATVRPCEDLDELFARSSIVTLHCPLTEQTRGMVDADRLGRMAEGSILVNTARGELVVEEDLAAALRAGRPAAAGLDVLSREPPAPDNPLIGLPNVLITPHCASGLTSVVHRKAQAVLENVQRALAGQDPWYRVV